MITILVDAINTFVVERYIDKDMFDLLESCPNKKIILSNANDEQIKEFDNQTILTPRLVLLSSYLLRVRVFH